ncbi:hypothetical protein [Flavobacterium sp.]|uniref:hypothetical protein n=1 Tax=Flavobacterium sp. TaxID=239 RepID=UPI0026118198|nr:hypothetical protein [Flavobacterium sp.]
MEIINYIFYRLHEYYRNDLSIFNATQYLSLLEMAGLAFFVLTARAIFSPHENFIMDYIIENDISKIQLSTFAILMYAVISFANYQYYKPKVAHYQAKFKNANANKWFKLWMISIIGIFLIGFPILLLKWRQS